MLKNYKELNGWQKSYEICLKVYAIQAEFPKLERYGLTSQIRKSVVSIESNIAKDSGRGTRGDYIRMLFMSYGSSCELRTRILLAGDLDVIEGDELTAIKTDKEAIEQMQKALIKPIDNKPLTP